MAIPFPDIDPYEVLQVSKSASPIEIKKSYKKLCLKFHPDKLQQLQQQHDPEFFPKVQFAYSIVSDPLKRQRYDNTGSLADYDLDDEDAGFNWKDYFESINQKITIDMIEEDKLKYQNSEEETEDIISNFIYYEGDFLKLFELIPHLEFTEEEEQRVFKVIENAMPELEESLDLQTTKTWEKYKKSRKTKVRQMLKKLAKEAKEAEELEKMIKDKGKKNLRSEKDLGALIRSRQENRLDSLIDTLESKYVNKKGKKRANKEIDDDEFERIQKGIMSKNKRSK
ncbi:DnaJ domain-containing protein [Scheffersomyces xylosifermentans]|uniref:DnaJ domain-containing protein n=1 Tax=Scheffersomyces xylosifermentans TaxID=1304137 RepID=UPI00315DA609